MILKCFKTQDSNRDCFFIAFTDHLGLIARIESIFIPDLNVKFQMLDITSFFIAGSEISLSLASHFL